MVDDWPGDILLATAVLDYADEGTIILGRGEITFTFANGRAVYEIEEYDPEFMTYKASCIESELDLP